MQTLHIILIYLIFINVLGFLFMGIDKKKAVHRKYRIPEKQLFALAILGGSAGSYMGMHVFRHKTKHKSFIIGIPVIILCQVLLAYIIGTKTGFL